MADEISLQKFVCETLCEIINGVADARDWLNKERNEATGLTDVSIALAGKGKRVETEVAFDVSVTATDTSGSKTGVGIFVKQFGLGRQGEAAATSTYESRVKFTIPVVLDRKPLEPIGKRHSTPL